MLNRLKQAFAIKGLTLVSYLCPIVGHASQKDHFWHDLPARVFNFLVLIAAGLYFGRHAILKAFEERAKNIERIVKKNNETYTKLLEEFDRYGKQIESLSNEHKEMIDDAHKEGKRLVEQQQKSAQKAIEAYQQDVQETIEIETGELKRRLALHLLDISMKKLSEEIKQKSTRLDQFYVDQFKKDGDKANLTLGTA